MKKVACLALVLMLIAASALADIPKPTWALFSYTKQALSYLASGEYERLVTTLPFSDVAPSASEWEGFARNFSTLSSYQTDYAVGYWTGSAWKVAVPVQVPDDGSVEVFVLISDDGNTFSGYRYTNWAQIHAEYSSSDYVFWDQEYVGGPPTVYAD